MSHLCFVHGLCGHRRIALRVVGPLITPRPPRGQVVVIAADSLGVADRADITLVGGFSALTGHGRQAIAQRAERAREAGSSSLADIVDKVVPELQDRGVYRTEYEGTTLREHLALPPLRPADAAARKAS
jgi:hypothetical protein